MRYVYDVSESPLRQAYNSVHFKGGVVFSLPNISSAVEISCVSIVGASSKSNCILRPFNHLSQSNPATHLIPTCAGPSVPNNRQAANDMTPGINNFRIGERSISVPTKLTDEKPKNNTSADDLRFLKKQNPFMWELMREIDMSNLGASGQAAPHSALQSQMLSRSTRISTAVPHTVYILSGEREYNQKNDGLIVDFDQTLRNSLRRKKEEKRGRDIFESIEW